MLRAIVFAVIGAGAMYLYLNPGDIAGLQETAREAANSAGQFIVEQTK